MRTGAILGFDAPRFRGFFSSHQGQGVAHHWAAEGLLPVEIHSGDPEFFGDYLAYMKVADPALSLPSVPPILLGFLWGDVLTRPIEMRG